MSVASDQDILDLFLCGSSYREISVRMRVSTSVISDVIRIHRITPHLNSHQLRRAEELWFKGFSSFEIARKLMVSEAAVHNSWCQYQRCVA